MFVDESRVVCWQQLDRKHLPGDDVVDDVTRGVHSGGLGVTWCVLRHAVNVGSDVTGAPVVTRRRSRGQAA